MNPTSHELQLNLSDGEEILHLNRDHVVRVAKVATELIVTTTSGKLVFCGQPETISEFGDLLLNDIQSNLVAVPSPLRLSVTARGIQE